MTHSPFTALELAEATGGILLDTGPGDACYTLCTDTRRLAPGQIYVALKGERFDGAKFFDRVLNTPNVGVMGDRNSVEQLPDERWAGRARIAVEDGVAALSAAAVWVRDRYQDIPFIGLTGTSGKTTTRTLIEGALTQALGRVHATVGNLNNHIGVPLTLLSMKGTYQAAVIEMGMSGPGEIRTLSQICRPTIRLITNIGRAHLDVLGDEQGVAKAKGELFETAQPGDTVILNHDDGLIMGMGLPTGVRVIRYGRHEKADLRLLDSDTQLGESFQVQVEGQNIDLRLSLPGAHNRLNATAALAVAWSLGLDLKKAADGMKNIPPEGMRFKIESLQSGARIINDAYNANPQSTIAGLKTAIELAGDPKHVRALLGEMLELGPLAEACHADVGKAAADLGIGQLMATGTYAKAVIDGASSQGMPTKNTQIFSDVTSMIDGLSGPISPETVFLVKGSRGARMERVAQALLGREGTTC